MLAIRMQRTGRKGHAQFRIIVQEAHRAPTSGRVVAQLGHYDPHSKTVVLEKERTTTYLQNGAQPSVRVAKLLENQGINLPKWVKLPSSKQRQVRHSEKLRKNRTADNVSEESGAGVESDAAEEAETHAEEEVATE